MYALIHKSRAILQVRVIIPKRSSDFSKLTSKVINYCEACASSYFRYYVNYLSFDLLLNCSYDLCTPTRIPWVLFAMACQYGKTFFSIHIERALNHDEMLRDTLNCLISKYRQIFTKSDTIPNRFAMTSWKSASSAKKNLRKSALSRARTITYFE